MASNTTKDEYFTPERIAELQRDLLEHPIDPAYDELCEEFDNDDPDVAQQQCSRLAYSILKSLGKLPEGIE